MNKTTNQYINQLNLDPKREAAVRKLVENAGGVNDSTPLVENLVGNELLPIKQDGENKAVSVEQIKNEVINNGVIELPSKYEFVDLGLPSGTKWATCNVGANSPEEAGLYFAWGETEGYTAEDVTADKKAFIWNDYKFTTDGDSTFTKYNETDGKLVLDLEDDAAYQSGNTCRMPTKDECQELIDNTTSTWEILNGINGRRLTSNTNGNSIFIPAAGYCYNDSFKNVGSSGVLWSSSLYESNSGGSWVFGVVSSDVLMHYFERCYGFTIRAVQAPNTPPTTINLKELQDKVDNLEIQSKDAKEVFIITPDMFEEATTTEIVTNAIQFTEDAWSNFKSAVWDHKIIGLSMTLFHYITNAAVPLSAVSENYAFSTYVSRHSADSYSLTFEIVSELLDIDRYEVFITDRQIGSVKNIMPDGHFIIDETMFTVEIADDPITSFELTDTYKQSLIRAIETKKVIGISNLALYYLVQSISTSNVNTRGLLPNGFSIINLINAYSDFFMGHVYYGIGCILLRIICLDGVIGIEKETMLHGNGDGTKFLADDGKYKEAGPVIIEYPLEGTEAVTLTDEQINAAKNSNIKLKLTGDSLDFTAIAIPYSYAISDTMIAIDIRISGTDSNIDQKLVIDIANKTIIRQ